MNWDAFFTLHDGLPREGPGDRDSLDWALGLAAVPGDGVICDAPSVRSPDYWAREYPEMTDAKGVSAQIHAAGFEILGQQPLSDAAWEAYFGPMERKIATLRPDADAALAAVLDEAEEEIAAWRACRADYGYLLCVVRPR